MENEKSALHFIYPQWQGGIINHWIPDIPAEDSSRSYYLGAQLLNYLAPQTGQKMVEVPTSLDINDRATGKGINTRGVILKQTRTVLDLLKENHPDQIITLGGECSVSVVPFTYLISRYPGDVAIIWISAYPGINLPYDEYKGYRAMALTACLRVEDEEIMELLPGKTDTSKTLIVGLRSWDKGMQERQGELGIKGLSPQEVVGDSAGVMEWLEDTGASKVVMHFDMDTLDPAEMIAAVGVEPNGMKIEEVIRIIHDISSECDLVGLTVTEPMPRVATRLKSVLNQLPLLRD